MLVRLAVFLSISFPVLAPASQPQGGVQSEQTAGPRSYLSSPLFLGEQPPECRTLEILHLTHGAEGQGSREEVLELAHQLRAQATDARRFRALAAEYSQAPSAKRGAVLGTFAPGVLDAQFDQFLFGAEIGDVSEPVVRGDAIFVLRRGERWAGCRMILIQGVDQEARNKIQAIQARLATGESFQEVAREVSQETGSAARGGDYQVFERGTQDRLLKRAVFEAPRGLRVGPLETPLGLVIAERTPASELAPELWESNWVQVHSLLVSHRQAPGAVELNPRSFSEALELVEDLARRIRTGEDSLEELASQYDDDLDAQLRRGNLGWIRTDSPSTQPILERVLHEQPGSLLGPLPLQIGYLLLKRVDS